VTFGLRQLGVLALLSALASGCSWLATPRIADGGGTTRPVLSEGELVHGANAICRRRAKAIRSLRAPRGREGKRRLFSRVVAIERAEFTSLATLRPPPAIERDYARFLGASLELVRISERFYVAFLNKDGHARRRALADAERISAAYDRAAQDLGLSCTQKAS
jgi:hypothetical protein